MTTYSNHVPVELPFLLVHGAIVWKVLLVVLTFATFAIVAVVRNWRVRRAARTQVARSIRNLTPVAEGAVTLRGRLHGDVRTIDTGDAWHHDRHHLVWLDCGGERIEVSGNAATVHGSRTTQVSWWRRSLLRGVHDGDEVIVKGTLRRSERCATYREDASSWQLVDAQISAMTPRTRARALGPMNVTSLAVIFAGVWYCVLLNVGERALERAKRANGGTFDQLSALSIAAAMPDSRDEVLRWSLGDIAARVLPRSDQRLRLMAQLDELQGDCPIDRFADAGQYEQAVEIARRCGRPAEIAIQLAILGRFAEARAALPAGASPALETGLALAVGDWAAAARGAEAIASNVEARKPGPTTTDADLQARALEARCQAALFRWLGGDRGAFERVKGKDLHRRCRAMEALTLPMQEQVDALIANLDREDDSLRRVVLAIAAMNGDDWAVGPAAERVYRDADPMLWIAPFVEANRAFWPSDEALIGADLLQRRLALLRGDFEAAKAGLDVTTSRYQHSQILLSALMRSGRPIPPLSSWRTITSLHEQQAELRGRAPVDAQGDGDRGLCIRDGDHAVRDAFDGDGAALVRRFRTCILGTYDLEALFTIVPHITCHRAELADALRLHGRAFVLRLPHLSFEVLEHAAPRRDLARLLGDTAEADRWAAIFARHAAPLTHRDRLIATLFWNLD